MTGKYFVVSNGDAPDQIFFDEDSAKADESRYIDVFDKDGKHVDCMMYDATSGNYKRGF